MKVTCSLPIMSLKTNWILFTSTLDIILLQQIAVGNMSILLNCSTCLYSRNKGHKKGIQLLKNLACYKEFLTLQMLSLMIS